MAGHAVAHRSAARRPRFGGVRGISYDILKNLTATAGARYYTYDNTLQGFYGFNENFSTSQGTATCFTPFEPYRGAPCQDLNGRTTGSGTSPKVNLTYKFDDERLIYATYAKGFRPGGVNRNGGGSLRPTSPIF